MRQVSPPADMIQAGASSRGSRNRPYRSIAVGALCGLAWSAGILCVGCSIPHRTLLRPFRDGLR